MKFASEKYYTLKLNEMLLMSNAEISKLCSVAVGVE
jgi:hypothetical protein